MKLDDVFFKIIAENTNKIKINENINILEDIEIK